MVSGPGQKMKPLKKARLFLLIPPVFTALLLTFTLLLLLARNRPALLTQAHIFTLGSNKVYLTVTCPDEDTKNPAFQCIPSADLNPIKWAAIWYWAAAVALATSLLLQLWMVHRPDPKWARWAFRALLAATFVLVMGSCITVSIGAAAAAKPIGFIGGPLSGSGSIGQTFKVMTIAMACVISADCMAMMYLKHRFRKEPVADVASPHSIIDMYLGHAESTGKKRDTKVQEDDSRTHDGFAANMQGFSAPPRRPGYPETSLASQMPSQPTQVYNTTPPIQPRSNLCLNYMPGRLW